MNTERIDGKLTLATGEIVSFSITPDYGYQQWGADVDTLWSTVPLMDGLVEMFNDKRTLLT